MHPGDGHVRSPGLGHTLVTALRFAFSRAPAVSTASFAALAATSLTTAALPLFIRSLIDATALHDTRGALLGAALAMVAVIILQRLLALVWSSLNDFMRSRICAAAVTAYLRKSVRIDGGYLQRPAFHDRMRRAGEAADDRFGVTLQGLGSAVASTTGLIGLISVMAGIAWPIAVLLVVSIVPWVYGDRRGFLVVGNRRSALADRRRKLSYLRTLLVENSAAEIIASGSGDYLARRYQEQADEIMRLERPAHVRQFWTILAGNLAAGVVLTAAFALTAVSAARGDGSVGDVAATITAMTSFITLSANLANAFSLVARHGTHLADLFEFLDLPPLLPVPEPATPLGERIDSLSLQGVSYRYPDATENALTDVDLQIRSGQLLAVVGENGAGKSTLTKLLLRFVDPCSGTVRLGGTDLRECDPQDVRAHCGVLFQDFARLHFSVADAVQMGQADRTRLDSALSQAQLDSLVARMPDGVETQLGSRFPGGRDLSGGEWQRLAIARLLYRNTPVVVLDEPTSALDPEGEEAIFAEVRRVIGARIGIVISHRFSTVRAADLIAVLHRGRLVEAGTHEELMALEGRYAHLFDLQAAGYR